MEVDVGSFLLGFGLGLMIVAAIGLAFGSARSRG